MEAIGSAAVMAKGINFVYFKKYVLQAEGERFWNALLESAPETDQSVWRMPVLSAWYPFEMFKCMFFRYAEAKGQNRDADLSRIYEYIARHSLSTIHRLLFKATASPHFVLSNYPKLWGQFFKDGAVEVLENANQRCRFCFVLPEIFLDWLPPACTGYTRMAVTLAGGRDVQIRESARERRGGLHFVSYEASWR